MQQFINIIIALLLIAGLLVVLEILARRKVYPANIARKVTHLASSLLICAVAFYILDYRWFILLGLVFAAVLFIARQTIGMKSIADRSHESFGEVFFALGTAAAALLCATSTQFIITMAILGLADTAAYFVGRNIKSAKLVFNKTLAGSLAFMIVSFMVALFTTTPTQALLIAACLAVVEIFSLYGSDNLSLPIISSVLLGFVV